MSVNLTKAKKQAAAKTESQLVKEIQSVVKNDSGWIRKSVALDHVLIDAIEQVAEKERKNFSQLNREALLALLKTRGVEL